jgi:hypothetical protein
MLEEQPETFTDVARICVKKSNKGPFDELITSLYRVQQLTRYIPLIEDKWDDKTVLMKCINKGLKYANFNSFKNEVEGYSGFSDLLGCSSIKDFYMLLQQEEEPGSIQIKLLRRFQSVLHDHEFALMFLKKWVTQEVENLEQQAAHVLGSNV